MFSPTNVTTVPTMIYQSMLLFCAISFAAAVDGSSQIKKNKLDCPDSVYHKAETDPLTLNSLLRQRKTKTTRPLGKAQ